MAGAATPHLLPETHPYPPTRARLFRRLHEQVGVSAYGLLLSSLVLVGFGLRLFLLDRFPLREDEAIYSYWALQFWKDPLFLNVWPDKPPLFLWLLAAPLRLLGPSAASARLLNVALSSMTVPVVAATARHLWGKRAGLWAALTFSLNPFAISFAATVYTDPLLIFCGTLAFYYGLRGRTFWAGLWLAAAIMTKQQGILYVPLVAGTLFLSRERTTRQIAQESLKACTGLASVLLPLLYWDSQRWAVAPSPWDLSLRHYGGLALVPPAQWLRRLAEWAHVAWYLTASWPIWLALGILAAGAVTLRLGGNPKTQTADTQQRPVLALLGLWALAFLIVHVVAGFQIWDRYLLPLAPALALFAGWVGARLPAPSAPTIPARWMALAAALWALLLLPPALAAAKGGLPVGGDHGDYAGLEEAITWLQENARADAVLYHRALGWHYRFYLYGETGPGGYDLRWYPNAVYLADNAAKTPHRRKFLIQPDWAPVHNAVPWLSMRGIQWRLRLRTGHFTVYEVVLPAQPRCDWCLCARRLPTGWPPHPLRSRPLPPATLLPPASQPAKDLSPIKKLRR